MSEQFKWCLYQNCSPTLRRVKPSNIFTLHKEKYPNWQQDLAECRNTLRRYGYDMVLLQENDRFLVVMVYCPDALRRCLRQAELRRYLQGMGYQEALPLEAKLTLLSHRFQQGSFPHEIGLFLGYPLDDVTGFIANKGENCKYSGERKVYGDVNRAKRLFRAYQDSRSSVFDQASHGMELDDILRAC